MEGHAVGHRRRCGGSGVSHVLESGLTLEMMWHHGMLWGSMRVARWRASHRVFILILVVQVFLAHEVFGAFVLVRTAIILIATDGLIDIARRELIQLLVVAEDYDGNIDGAENGELVSLFEKTTFALEKGYGAVPVILDGLDLDLSATHGGMPW